jgi:hypothetical protein
MPLRENEANTSARAAEDNPHDAAETNLFISDETILESSNWKSGVGRAAGGGAHKERWLPRLPPPW